MRRYILFFAFAAFALLVGFIVGWWQASNVSSTRLQQVVAMSWGNCRNETSFYKQPVFFEPWFYGAHVYLEPMSSGYSVRARVYITRDCDYFHDCGELGVVRTPAEAVARWGAIDWREDGLHIGRGENQYFLPRAELEHHR
jgi:hypothetical protein